MKKDGFTLVELLAVVIILAIISLFVMPKVADLIKSGNSTNTSIIEQKLLTVARTYTNDYDTRFFNRFVNVGYASIITKDELIDAGLVTSDEGALVEDFRGVRVELLDNNKIKYTIARLGDSNDYTNEELYQMIKQLQDDNKVLASQITNNTTSGSMFLKVYPVGSIYISTSSENPGNIYGGTWELLWSDYDYKYIASQVDYPEYSSTTTAGATDTKNISGAYSKLFTNLENYFEEQNGYKYKYRFSFSGSTTNNISMYLKINNVRVTDELTTWSVKDFRAPNISNKFYELGSDIKALSLASLRPGYNGDGYIYQIVSNTVSSGDYYAWDITKHLYLVSNDKFYKWKRTA